jgi:hypothetical protein
MRLTTQVTEFTGFNESPVGGNFILSSNRSFYGYVVAGTSILYNKTQGTSGTVSSLSATRVANDTINAPVLFAPGDLFLVTLATPWTIQNSDGPIVSVDCSLCGYSYPAKELVGGLCKWCRDADGRRASGNTTPLYGT